MSTPVDEQTKLLRKQHGVTSDHGSSKTRWSVLPSVATVVATVATVAAVTHGVRQMWIAGSHTGAVPTSQLAATLTANPYQPLMRVRMWGDTNAANQEFCVVSALSDRCDVIPSQEEFCVYVNTNDFYYRMSDMMGASRDSFPMTRVMSDPRYDGSLLRTLFSDDAFEHSDPPTRTDMLATAVDAKQCEVYGDDTLLLHIRSGDSGWIDRAAARGEADAEADMGEGDDEKRFNKSKHDNVQRLGLIDANAIAGVMNYLDSTPQINRVIMRTTLHFGVPEPGDEGNDPDFASDSEHYGISGASLWGSNSMLRDIYNQIQARGKETWVTSNADADQDACEYAKACHFISPDGRGFSQLMTTLNQMLHRC
jgi:hypothetical protein